MTYDQARAYVASLAPRGWRLGLDRMEELVRRSGLSDAVGPKPKFVHVAGTNGKGSVTAYAESILVEAGHRVGGFYSPFVYNIRERVQLQRKPISEPAFARLVAKLAKTADTFDNSDFGSITEFEFKTAVGLAFWKESECDWVSLEVGLGGRLDSTNVVDPAVSVVVSIGLDHTSILGDTVEAIAFEKAGIAKPGRPMVVGKMAHAAREVVLREAALHGSPVWVFGQDIRLDYDESGSWTVETPVCRHSGLLPGMQGAAQPHNMALAVAALDACGANVDDEAIRKGVVSTRLPGRFERRVCSGRLFILDGAHNAEASEVLAETFRSVFPSQKCVVLSGMVAGHDPERFFRPLSEVARIVHTVPIDFHRSRDPNEVASAAERCGLPAQAHKRVEDGLEAAIQSAEDDEPILVTGSFYLLGEVAPILPS